MSRETLLTPVNVVGVVALAVGVTLAVTSRDHGGASPATVSSSAPVSRAPSAVRTATPTGNGASQRIDADRLDGLDSTAFQRRVTGSCTGAVTAVNADGSLACRALTSATKVVWDTTVVFGKETERVTTLASFPGGRLVGRCELKDRSDPTLRVVVEATGKGGLVNGIEVRGSGSADGSEAVATRPIGVAFGPGRPGNAVRLSPGYHVYGRSEASLWVSGAEGVTHVALHGFVDQRDDSYANHCTVWGVVT